MRWPVGDHLDCHVTRNSGRDPSSAVPSVHRTVASRATGRQESRTRSPFRLRESHESPLVSVAGLSARTKHDAAACVLPRHRPVRVRVCPWQPAETGQPDEPTTRHFARPERPASRLAESSTIFFFSRTSRPTTWPVPVRRPMEQCRAGRVPPSRSSV